MAPATMSKLQSFVLPLLLQTLSFAYGILTLTVFCILAFTSKRAFLKLSQKEKEELEIGIPFLPCPHWCFLTFVY